jgi:hypothetical protein
MLYLGEAKAIEPLLVCVLEEAKRIPKPNRRLSADLCFISLHGSHARSADSGRGEGSCGAEKGESKY